MQYVSLVLTYAKGVKMYRFLVSIIIPVYNIEAYIKECVNSVLTQTYKNLEIILVDDGSTDESGRICDKLKKQDERIVVIHKKNGGLSDARNCGIGHAHGEYIGLVDGDDVISPVMYESMLNAMLKYDVDIVTCRKAENKKTIQEQRKHISQKDIIDITSGFDAIYYLFNDYICGNYAWNKLYKRELFNKVKYPKRRFFEDIYTTHLLFLESNKVLILNKNLYYYRTRENQITNSKKVPYKLIKDHIEAFIFRIKDSRLDKYHADNSKVMLNCLKRCKRLAIANKITNVNKKDAISYINGNIKTFCTKGSLSKSDYLQSRVLLYFNHFPILYFLTKLLHALKLR